MIKCNWYQCLIKRSAVHGEFWITDSGYVMGAGEDDQYDHVSHVITTAQDELMDNETEDWEYWMSNQASKILSQEKESLEEQLAIAEDGENESQIEKVKNDLYANWEMTKNIDYYVYDLIFNNVANLGIDPSVFNAANGIGDPRKFAMKHWGWKRLADDVVETWTLTRRDLDIISRGLYDAYDENVENQIFSVNVVSTETWFMAVPYEAIESGNISQIRQDQFRGWVAP